jgi:hypothetical protein
MYSCSFLHSHRGRRVVLEKWSWTGIGCGSGWSKNRVYLGNYALMRNQALVTLHVLPRLEEYSLVPVEWIGRIGQMINYLPRFYSSKVHFVIDFAELVRISDLVSVPGLARLGVILTVIRPQ